MIVCPFSFRHYIVCLSSMYGRQYPFGIFKPFFLQTNKNHIGKRWRHDIVRDDCSCTHVIRIMHTNHPRSSYLENDKCITRKIKSSLFPCLDCRLFCVPLQFNIFQTIFILCIYPFIDTYRSVYSNTARPHR